VLPSFATVSDHINKNENLYLRFKLIFVVIAVHLGSSAAKICYQCDEKNPSTKLKFWGEKITKCSGVPFEKYATKTSRAFGAAVLTCYTVKL
jgi:hypothetical protein